MVVDGDRSEAVRAARAALLCAAISLAPASIASAQSDYLGAASCASSVCHGSLVARDGINILQNEYRIWAEHDRHASAYQTLQTERSQTIAANLGLGDPTSEGVCLDCHSTHAPAERRGPKFQLSDGVSCESCHGAAGGWIQSHDDADQTHADNLARGLVATDDPAQRATVCLSCHVGDTDRAVSHKIMAAGHPRMSFELDTFSYLQPAHFRTDTDYADRKGVATSAAVWAAGQASALGRYVALLADPRQGSHGRWPEFALFDCFSCHHSIGTEPIAPGTRAPTAMGLPRFERANALMYRTLVDVALAERAEALSVSLAQLGETFAEDEASAEETAALARAILDRTEEAAALLSNWSPTGDELAAIVGKLSAPASLRDYTTYTDAEQVTMALQALLATAGETADADPVLLARWNAALDRLFDATADPSRFRMDDFRRALVALR